MNRLRSLTLVPLLLLMLPALATPTPAYTVKDLTPTFWRFWDKARDKPEAEQLRLLRKLLVDSYPDVYTAEVLGLDTDLSLDEALVRRWPRYLSFVGKHLDTARALSAALKRDLPRYESHFRRAFPDLAYTGEVYFVASLGAFDGGTRRVKGRMALLFGVDVIAAIYPMRAGYYVGYLVARELGRTHSLPELARLRGPPLRGAIEAVLRQLESPAPATP